MDEFFDVAMRFSDREWNAIDKAAAKIGKTKNEYIKNILFAENKEWVDRGNFIELTIMKAFFKANRINLHPPKRVKLKPRKQNQL